MDPQDDEDEYVFDDGEDNGGEDDEPYVFQDDHGQQLKLPEMKRNESKQTQFLKVDEVYKELIRKLEKINLKTELDLDKNLLIFQYYKWNREKLQENYFSDTDKVFQEIGLQFEEEQQKLSKTEPPTTNCVICYDQPESFPASDCHHKVCESCWLDFLSQNIKNKKVILKCASDCQSYVKHSFIEEILIQNQKTELHQQYIKFLGMLYVEDSKNTQFCPNPACDVAILNEDFTIKNVKCMCGTEFCFKCRNCLHDPANCAQVKDWLNIINKDDANLQWIMANATLCPSCKGAVEKSMGCNYVVCQCGRSFCFVCGEPWDNDSDGSHHKSSHMNCHKYRGDQKQKAEDVLQKYNFYYERYLNCAATQQKCIEFLDQIVEPIRAEFYNQLGIPLQESEFLSESLKILIETREILQWSYCFGYNIEKQRKKSQELFEMFQSDFENICEQLAIAFDRNLNALVNKTKIKFDVMAIQQEFFDLKGQITTISQSTKNRREKLIDIIESGQVYVD